VLSEQPEVAIVAVTHALAAQTFYRGADAHVLDISPAISRFCIPTIAKKHARSGQTVRVRATPVR